MYTIQYEGLNGETKTQSFDSNNRGRLVKHVASFERPVVAVFEQATPITEAVRNELKASFKGRLSNGARAFAFPMNRP